MAGVKNKKAVRLLALRALMAAKGKSAAGVCAVILTASMFTALFTIGGSFISKTQQEMMRQTGASGHVVFKYMTQEEYDILKTDPKIREVSRRIVVGNVMNEELKKLHTEACWMEEREAQQSFCYPSRGRMPEAENEIVTSDLVLHALGVPAETGETVHLNLSLADRKVSGDFIVSGVYEGDAIAPAQLAAVSKKFQEIYAPAARTSILKTGPVTEEDYIGRIMAQVNFNSSFFLRKKAEALRQRCGFPSMMNTGINEAYLSSGLDLSSVFLAGILFFVFFLSGYLIIFNIFYISVYAEIRNNGLLKTVGMTGRQLRRMVRLQADLLSAAGIPAGLLLGAAGKILLPVIMDAFSNYRTTDGSIVLQPAVFAGAAVFSWLTVRISCKKPCRMAAASAPLEALRAVETGRSGRKQKKSRKVSPFFMAAAGLRRKGARAAASVLSMSLAMIVLNSVFGLVSGFKLDAFISGQAVSDFSVVDASILNVSIMEKTLDGISRQFLKELQAQDGIAEISNVYVKDYYPQFSEEDWEKIEERVISSELFLDSDMVRAEAEMTEGGMEAYLEYIRRDRPVDSLCYGIGRLVFEKLEHVEGTLDWEKFKSGGYIITGRFLDTAAYFYPGEKVTLFNEQGESREYEVMAAADVPYAAGVHYGSMFNCNYILPEEEFLEFMGSRKPLSTLFNVETDSDGETDRQAEQKIEAWLENYCSGVETDLTYMSKGKIEQEFNSLAGMIKAAGTAAAAVLALTGCLNFINTMFTSVITRRKEFAVLEAVGMTPLQQKKMLAYEGLIYAAASAAVSLVLSSISEITIVKKIGEEYFFYEWHFTLMPVLLCLPLLFLFAAGVPAVCGWRMRRESVMERIRTASESG